MSALTPEEIFDNYSYKAKSNFVFKNKTEKQKKQLALGVLPMFSFWQTTSENIENVTQYLIDVDFVIMQYNHLTDTYFFSLVDKNNCLLNKLELQKVRS